MTATEKMIEILEKAFPEGWFKDRAEFDGGEGIWTGENSFIGTGENIAEIFNYWSQDYNTYECGVHTEFIKVLAKNNWWSEAYDAGTLMLHQD